jgi:hypothetical protein
MTTAYRYRSGILVVLGMLTSASVTACDSGCDTTVTAFAGTAHRTGSSAVAAEIHLDVSAKLTSGGKGVGVVRLVFDGMVAGENAVGAAGAVTDAGGIAHYSGPADYGLAKALTSVTTAQTFSYTAQAVVPGSTPDSSVCNLLDARSQRSELRYEP